LVLTIHLRALLAPGRPIRALAIGRVRSRRIGIESIFSRSIQSYGTNVASMLRVIASNVASRLRATSKYQRASSLLPCCDPMLRSCCDYIVTMLRPCCVQHPPSADLLPPPPMLRACCDYVATMLRPVLRMQHPTSGAFLSFSTQNPTSQVCNIETRHLQH
jgi:hypothetical protein